MAVVEHMHVLTQAQKVRYRRLLQPFDPGVADEFAICCQRSHRLIGERRLEDLHQINPLGGIGIARLVEDTPKQWDAHVAMSHAQHQYVQIGLAKLPVGAVNRQMPRLALSDTAATTKRATSAWFSRTSLKNRSSRRCTDVICAALSM